MVEISVTSSPGTSRAVTFQSQNEPSEKERRILTKIHDIFPNERDDAILVLIRKQAENLPIEEIEARVVDKIMKKIASDPPEVPTASFDKGTESDVAIPMEFGPYSPSSSNKADLYDRQDSDLQRALQESLKVSPVMDKYAYAFSDRLTMIRDPNRRAGLKNMGNTCWFNSVAQMFYSIPAFRTMILQCVPHGWKETPVFGAQNGVTTEIELLLLLRSLFAHLRFTEIAFIECSTIVKVMDTRYRRSRGILESTIDHQQDASEMMIFMLEWIEIAFTEALKSRDAPIQPLHSSIEDNFVVADSTTGAPNSDFAGVAPPAYDSTPGTSAVVRDAQTRDNSPIREMPSSSRSVPPPQKIARTEAVAEAVPIEFSVVEQAKETFEKMFEATFTPIVISGEGADLPRTSIRNCPQYFNVHVSHGNLHDALEAATYESRENSDVRNFFGSLPPVMLFGLSRFGYNGGTSKLHDKFSFPKTLFMDRYMLANEEMIVGLREQQFELREALSLKRAHRKGLTQYPHGEGETRLADAFKTVLEAITNKRSKEEPSKPAEQKTPEFIGPLLPSAFNETKKQSDYVRDQGKVFPAFDTRMFPKLDSCVETLETALQQLSIEENACIEAEKELEAKIEKVYDVEELHKHQYHLHGVIVHAGEASHGHYYTFLRKIGPDGTEEWERLSDHDVRVAPYSEVETDAFGTGNPNDPSAYVILYVRSDADWIMTDDMLTLEESFNNLSIDLQEEVKAEQVEWREEVERFRNRKEGDSDAKETTSPPVAWLREGVQQQQDEGDENANPTQRIAAIGNRLSEQMLVLTDDVMGEVNLHAQVLWHSINEVSPERFSSASDLLDYHLKLFMCGPEGGIAYIEKKLTYSLQELREDAENDIDIIYNKFISDYVDDSLKTKDCRFRFVFFSHVLLLDVAVLRFLIVRAMAVNEQCYALQKRAQLELLEYQAKCEESLVKMQKVAYLLAMIYEVGSISAMCCRNSIERFNRVQKNGASVENKISREQIYLSLKAARNARSLSKILENSTKFIKSGGIHFLNDACLEYCSLPPLLAQVKMLIEVLLDSKKDLETSLSFLSSQTDTQVTADDVIAEVGRGIRFSHAWAKNEFKLESSSEAMLISGADSLETSKLARRTGENDLVYQCLESTVSLLGQIPRIQGVSNKSQCLHSLHRDLQLAEENEMKLVAKMHKLVPDNIYCDLEKIHQLWSDAEPVTGILTKLIQDVSTIISNKY